MNPTGALDYGQLYPHFVILERLALAMGVGLFVGLEREYRRKEAGLRTFACAAILGGIAGVLGRDFALEAVALMGVLVVLLNAQTLRANEGTELTTSAALLLTTLTGVLAGQGHTFTPVVLAVITAALLAWKEPLAGFSQALTESELRSAILLAILAFVVYPALPTGDVDPWNLINPREAWVTVILIAAIGFVNYILLKIYGDRGAQTAGFLGGLVNSTVAATELARRTKLSAGRLAQHAYVGLLLALLAMLMRNAFLLLLFCPRALPTAGPPLLLMTFAGLGFLYRPLSWPESQEDSSSEPPLVKLSSPFSITSTLKFGAAFLILQICGTLSIRSIGQSGFFLVSLVGGFVSSASSVASAATLAQQGTISTQVAGVGAVLATFSSAMVNLPIIFRTSDSPLLSRRISQAVISVILLGSLGVMAILMLGRVIN